MKTSSPALVHVPALNGVCGLAVAMVVVVHAYNRGPDVVYIASIAHLDGIIVGSILALNQRSIMALSFVRSSWAIVVAAALLIGTCVIAGSSDALTFSMQFYGYTVIAVGDALLICATLGRLGRALLPNVANADVRQIQLFHLSRPLDDPAGIGPYTGCRWASDLAAICCIPVARADHVGCNQPAIVRRFDHPLCPRSRTDRVGRASGQQQGDDVMSLLGFGR